LFEIAEHGEENDEIRNQNDEGSPNVEFELNAECTFVIFSSF
jgi:hypothetical protein